MIHSVVGLMKKTLYIMSQYFPQFRNSKENIIIELDLSSYATKANLKMLHELMLVAFH